LQWTHLIDQHAAVVLNLQLELRVDPAPGENYQLIARTEHVIVAYGNVLVGAKVDTWDMKVL
jgi:hypothetical protein